MVSAYWWCGANGVTNFGDVMTELLLQHFCGVAPMQSTPAAADVVISGSVLDVVPNGWTGIVAGAGTLHERTRTDLTNAKVLGLRGLLTAQNVKVNKGSCVIGDPGLLASELVAVSPDKYHLGVVPHWSDTEGALAKKFAYLNPLVILPTGDPLTIISQIGSCSKIVSSSLHGLVVADSYGVPRRAEMFPKIDHPWEGSTWKFRDYSSALGMEHRWGVKGGECAPESKVEQIKHDLFAMFQELKELLNAQA